MGSYQSFSDRPGSSPSADKLAAIRLPKNLRGKRVLDLGCNEGFFALEAKRRGAERVVGVDHSQKAIDAARAKAAEEALEVDFLVADMKDGPDEKFDYVLLLSALHYVDEPAAFLAGLRKRLSANGVLILECGVSPGSGRSVARALRSIDERLFPTADLLIDGWLGGYAVRRIGQSPAQPGDPIGREVFHCARQRPTVVFITGEGKAGKTSLARLMGPAPRISVDEIAAGVQAAKRRSVDPEQQRFDDLRAANRGSVMAAWREARGDPGMVGYFAERVAGAIRFCQPAPLVTAEGFMLADLAKEIRARLGAGFRYWTCSDDGMGSDADS